MAMPLEVRLIFMTWGHEWQREHIFEDGDTIKVSEFENLNLRFEAPSGCRVYLDGLDSYPATSVQHDEEGVPYLAPGLEPFLLYVNSDEDYPLIPADYAVTVKKLTMGKMEVVAQGVLEVAPKHFSRDQLDRLRHELNAAVKGLAYDQVRALRGVEWDEGGPEIPPPVLLDYEIIRQIAPQLGWILESIMQNPARDLRHEYVQVTSRRPVKQDAKSYRWSLTPQGQRLNVSTVGHPEIVLGAKVTVTHDIPENRWAASFLTFLLGRLEQLLQSVRSTLTNVDETITFKRNFIRQESTKREIQRLNLKREKLGTMEQTIKQGIFQVRRYLEEPFWYELLPKRPPHINTMKIERDWRYRKIWQWWKGLRQEDIEIRLSADFQLHWKSTSLLYEYWCFMRTIEALRSQGYRPLRGWIYDLESIAEEWVIPMLKGGTTVSLGQGETRLDVVFNEAMPRGRRKALASGKILFMEGPNFMPDLRIDVFEQEAYKGSLVLDAKYSRHRSIWNPLKVEDVDRPSNMNQIQNYANSLKYVHDATGTSQAQRVIVLYPGTASDAPVEEIEDTRITLVTLAPSPTGQAELEWQETGALYGVYMQSLIEHCLAQNKFAPPRKL